MADNGNLHSNGKIDSRDFFKWKTNHVCLLNFKGKKVVPCRHDWHQTGREVTISIYAKNSIPELSRVEANSTLVSYSFALVG